MKPNHFVHPSCKGEACHMCLAPATHKIGEELTPETQHNYTAYVCCDCFKKIFGKWTHK